MRPIRAQRPRFGLIDTTAWYGAGRTTQWAERADKAVQSGLASLVEFQTTRWFGDAFRASASPKSSKHCVECSCATTSRPMRETCRMLGRARPARGACRASTMPTAVIVGEEDYATPRRDGAGAPPRHCRLDLTVLRGRAPPHAARTAAKPSPPSLPAAAGAARPNEVYRRAHRQGAARARCSTQLRDARFFASCVDGVRDLAEIVPDRYAAVFETKVAYMKFSFKVTVELTRADPPHEIEAKVEGAPLGVVGRHDRDLGDDAERGRRRDHRSPTRSMRALTGKLGSLGQPVLRAKAREMEKQFAARLRAAFDQSSRGGGRNDAVRAGRAGSRCARRSRCSIPTMPRCAPIAGGTALMLMMKAGVFRPTRLVSLRSDRGAVRDRRGAADGELQIGAMTPLCRRRSAPPRCARMRR